MNNSSEKNYQRSNKHFLNNNVEEFVNYGSNGLLLIRNNTLPSIKLITKQKYLQNSIWGLLTSIDLFNCDPDLIRDAEAVKRYVYELCDLIGMKRFGECIVVDFGEDPKVSGFSMTQLIETSLISGHFANQSNSAYIDIFSCKWYDQKKAIEFTKNFFKAKRVKANILPRGKGII